MKLNLILILCLVLGYFSSFGALKEQEKQGMSEINLLKNAGFENILTGWSVSGGSFTHDRVTPLFGKGSAIWDPNALGQTLESDLVTIELGMNGKTCVAYSNYTYSGTAGDIAVSLLDDSNNVIVAEQDLAVVSDAQEKLIGFFTCDSASSGQYKIRFESKVVDAGALEIDRSFIGIGKSFTGQGEWKSLGVNYLTFNTGTTGVKSDLTYNNLEVGKRYRLQGQINFKSTTTGNGIVLEIKHGSTVVKTLRYNSPSATATGEITVDPYFEFVATDTSIVFDVLSVGANVTFEGDGTKAKTWVELFERPSAGEAINLETTGWYVSGSIGGAEINLSTSDVTSYSVIENASLSLVKDSGSRDVEIACNGTEESTGLTCATQNETLGISVDIPSAGDYMSCWTFTHRTRVNTSNTSLTAAFQIVETPNNALTISRELGPKLFSGIGTTSSHAGPRDTIYPINFCRIIPFTSAGKKTLRIFHTVDASGTPDSHQLPIDRSGSQFGGRQATFSMFKVNEGFSTPVFTDLKNSLTSKLEAGTDLREVSIAYDCKASPSILENYMPEYIQSVSRVSTASCQVNFEAGTFSDRPICSCAADGTGIAVNVTCGIADQWDANAVRFYTYRTDNVGVDARAQIRCIGPK